MSATSAVALAYGAWELKSSYQRNFALAAFLAMLIAVMPVVGHRVYEALKNVEAVEAPTIVIKSITDIAPPPSIIHTQPMPRVAAPDVAPPAIGIPTPVPDETITEEVHFATRAELAELSQPVGSSVLAGADSVVVAIPTDEYFPAPDEFVAVQEHPVRISCIEELVYPEMARLTGVHGSVWVKALIGKDGKVRDVLVVRPSGSSVGFEEAALAQARTCTYRPAIQNGQPVALWVAYEVKFSLK